MKKIWILLCILAAVGTVSVISYSKLNQSKEVAIVQINGQAVAMSEFKMILDRHRSEVYRFFDEQYGVQDSADFWTQSINGDNPGEMVKRLALEELVSWKVQLAEAQKFGLINDSSYAAFLNRLSQENKRREEDQRNQKPVFGPLSFDEQTFYDYEKSNLISQLKKTLAQQVWKVTDDRLAGFYDQNKERLYRNVYTMKIRKAGISYLDRDGIANEQLKQQSLKLLTDARQAISSGASFNEAIGAMARSTDAAIIREDQTFDESTVLQDARMYNQIWTAAQGMQPGQVSDPIEAFDGAYYLIELADKRDNGYKSFQTIRDQVEVAYIDQKYGEYLQQEVQRAKVEIDQKSWSAIELR